MERAGDDTAVHLNSGVDFFYDFYFQKNKTAWLSGHRPTRPVQYHISIRANCRPLLSPNELPYCRCFSILIRNLNS
jgi:hypothetical protein